MHIIHENLPAGLYMLTQDVQNPEPDRRYKDKWTASATWEKGRLFRVEDAMLERGSWGVAVHIRSGNRYGSILAGIRPVVDGVKDAGVKVRRNPEDVAQARALVPYLAPVPVTLGNVEHMYPDANTYQMSYVLREMARRGLVTESQALNVFVDIAKGNFFPADE